MDCRFEVGVGMDDGFGMPDVRGTGSLDTRVMPLGRSCEVSIGKRECWSARLGSRDLHKGTAQWQCSCRTRATRESKHGRYARVNSSIQTANAFEPRKTLNLEARRRRSAAAIGEMKRQGSWRQVLAYPGSWAGCCNVTARCLSGLPERWTNRYPAAFWSMESVFVTRVAS